MFRVSVRVNNRGVSSNTRGGSWLGLGLRVFQAITEGGGSEGQR